MNYQTVALPSTEADISQSQEIFDTLWHDLQELRFDPGDWAPIAGAPIDDGGNILLGIMGEQTADLKLYNVITHEEKLIDSISNDYYYAYAGSNEEYMVYFTYKTMQNMAIPTAYKIIDLQSLESITADVSGISVNDDVVYIDSHVSIYQDKMYFEVNCREQKVSGNKVEDYGLSVYAFDLNSKTFDEVIQYAASPTATVDGLYYLEAADDDSATLFLQDWNGTTTKYFSNVIEYSVYDNDIVWIEAVENDSVQRNVNLFHNGVNQVFYTSSDFYFWDIRYNGTYVTWQQSSAPLYIYDVGSESFYLVSDVSGARYAIASEQYMYWFEVTRQGETKDDIDIEVVFVEL